MLVTDALAQRLREQVNPDGGWGYTPGSRSRVEPTSWALLALTAATTQADGWSPAPHLGFLRRAQTSRGLLADQADAPPNYAFNALAALVVDGTYARPTEPWFLRLTEAIIGGRGAALPADEAMPQQNNLQAWPWIDGCFSWVEPTAWCLLLLKRLRAQLPDGRSAARIAEAERLLFDRCCAGGGWNYGNATVLGQSLEPFVPTTALALLALQDRKEHATVKKSLAHLQTNALGESSGMALALSLICFVQYGLPTKAIEEALAAQYARSRFLDQQHVMAMALYALAWGRAGMGAFHV